MTDLIGGLACILVLVTFCMRDMVKLRLVAIASNIAFIVYAGRADLMPVLALHAILLPINLTALYALRERSAFQWRRRSGECTVSETPVIMFTRRR